MAEAFNKKQSVFQKRTPSNCKERWENTLKTKFKRFFFNQILYFERLNVIFRRGTWSNEEDLTILNFVLENGTKWAKLSRILQNRTEHSVKNRFFGLMAEYSSIPILKLKKHVNYLNSQLISEAISYNSFPQEEKNDSMSSFSSLFSF